MKNHILTWHICTSVWFQVTGLIWENTSDVTRQPRFPPSSFITASRAFLCGRGAARVPPCGFPRGAAQKSRRESLSRGWCQSVRVSSPKPGRPGQPGCKDTPGKGGEEAWASTGVVRFFWRMNWYDNIRRVSDIECRYIFMTSTVRSTCTTKLYSEAGAFRLRPASFIPDPRVGSPDSLTAGQVPSAPPGRSHTWSVWDGFVPGPTGVGWFMDTPNHLFSGPFRGYQVRHPWSGCPGTGEWTLELKNLSDKLLGSGQGGPFVQSVHIELGVL